MARGRKTALTIHLTAAERQTLMAWQRSTAIPAGRARRGRIILLLADRVPIAHIADTVGISRRFVYKWAQRFLTHGIEGLTNTLGRGRGQRRGTRQDDALYNGMESQEKTSRVVEVIYYVAASIDGSIAPADGTLSWLTPFESAGEDYGYTVFYQSIDAVLLGRHTFEHAAGFAQWPYPNKPCWVFARRHRPVAQPEVVVTDHSPREVVAALATRGVRRAWLVGGGQLAGAFRAQGLITEYIIAVIPIVLGTGIPLFGAAGPTEPLHLVASHVYPNGLVQLHYRRAHKT